LQAPQGARQRPESGFRRQQPSPAQSPAMPPPTMITFRFVSIMALSHMPKGKPRFLFQCQSGWYSSGMRRHGIK
jgi:hypothetical protein